MIKNRLLTRYKRSVLGVVWTILNPLLMMVVISLVFSLIFGRSPGYPVFVLSGMILWNFFTQTTISASNSLAWGGGLMKRIYFPRSTFVVTDTGSGIINLIISMLPLFIIMIITDVKISPALIFLPIAVILTSLFVLGVSFFLAAVAVFFSDVIDLYQALIRALFYLTPVMYSEEILPNHLAALIKINPLFNFVTIFRFPIYEGKFPPWDIVGNAVFYAIISLVLGGQYFIHKSKQVSYRL